MYPWYVQLSILLVVTIVTYPIIVLIVLKYFYFPMLMKSIAREVTKLDQKLKDEEERDLERALENALPPSENPLETGDCKVILGNIVRKDDEDDDMTEDELRAYFWG